MTLDEAVATRSMAPRRAPVDERRRADGLDAADDRAAPPASPTGVRALRQLRGGMDERKCSHLRCGTSCPARTTPELGRLG